MTQYPARPSTFTQLTTTDDWERFVSCAGTWDGVDGTGSLSPGLDNVNRGVVIQPGTCMIKGQLWRCDAAVTIPYLATPSQDRIDMLVMRLTRQASTAATVVTPTLLQGPTATPAVPPALTQQATPGIWDIPVCQLTMHANGNVDTLIDVRQLVGRAVVSMFSTARPSPTNPRLGLEVDTGYVLRWDGTSWDNIGPKNQVLGSGYSITGVNMDKLHDPFTIPLNDAALSAVAYRIRCGGHGRQAANTPVKLNFQVYGFGQPFGEAGDTGGIAAGQPFNWDFDGELVVAPAGSASFYGKMALTQQVDVPGSKTSITAMSQQYPNGTLLPWVQTNLVFQAGWQTTSGSPSITCIGASFERITS